MDITILSIVVFLLFSSPGNSLGLASGLPLALKMTADQ